MDRDKKTDIDKSTQETTHEVSFVPDVHLIQVLGEQLISSEKVGILELIKNAYDAGASRCTVWIEKVPGLTPAPLSDPALKDLDGPVITIADNGTGMSERIIRDGWLRPAPRLKTSVKERLKRERELADQRGTRGEYEHLVSTLKAEHGGRLPLGEKGVGRFSAHRLGRYMSLQTKSAHEPNKWFLFVDWDEFKAEGEAPRSLESVTLKLVGRPPSREYGPSDSGTVLRIWGGRRGYEWTAETIRQIGQSIALLRSPGRGRQPGGLEAEFRAPQ